MLTVGADPLEFGLRSWANELQREKHPNWKHAIMIYRSMCEAICEGSMVAIRVGIAPGYDERHIEYVDPESLELSDAEKIVGYLTKISRKSLRDWYKKNGYIDASHTLPAGTNQLALDQTKTEQQAAASVLLPRRTYTTPSLEVLEEVVQEHWEGYDPKSPGAVPPKQDIVTEAIYRKLEERGVKPISRTFVEYIDRIARHPSAKSGGNKKAKG